MTKSAWNERIKRAEDLAARLPFASEMLLFYREIACFQRDLYGQLLSGSRKEFKKQNGDFLRTEFDLALIMPHFPSLLSLVARVGPPPLASRAQDLGRQGRPEWDQLLTTYWEQGGRFEPMADYLSTFCARAFLQPYAEWLAERAVQPQIIATQPVCPHCQAMPQVGVLRQEGDGSKRSLICSLCATEWGYRRIVCLFCGEEDEKKLCYYAADGFEHVRVEACERCKTYIETVDLTKNGLAVPLVDELASVPLTLWAQEKGYTKRQSNLLGM